MIAESWYNRNTLQI